ncbi:MAG: hypothetical protein LBK69_02565 [Syntrophomonadaceae bacterium]|jgi:hypothetical protein|nr:hypothetical protein [Syntrophomonadaceae bacterium]
MRNEVKTIKKDNVIELIADTVTPVYIKNGKEIVTAKTPQHLNDYILTKLNLSEHKKYSVLICLVTNGQYNFMTNKKGVWGITGQPIGLFENSYLCDKGKVYFGITDNINIHKIQGLVSYIDIYIPKTDIFPYEKVFEMFSVAKYDLASFNSQDNSLLEEMQKSIFRSVIIKYAISSIKIFGDKIERFF